MSSDASVSVKVENYVNWIIELMNQYQSHKDEILLKKIALARELPDHVVKKCSNRSLDPFSSKLWTGAEIQVDYDWTAETSFYQPYYPIKQNVHLADPMDWMELAKPNSFDSNPPKPMVPSQETHCYPPDLQDERHVKLTLLMQLGFESFGFDPVFLTTIALLFNLPDSLVLSYFLKNFKNESEGKLIAQGLQAPNLQAATELAKAQKKRRLEYLKNEIFGGEDISSLVSYQDLHTIDTSTEPAANRCFLLMQYFCPHCEIFFCPDHINSEYLPCFYFQYDETEFSELRSDMFASKKRNAAEIERLPKERGQAPLQQYITCPAGCKTCWKSVDSTTADVIVVDLQRNTPHWQLERTKNLLRVCLNSSTNNSCYISYTTPGYTCLQIGALMYNIWKDEFKTGGGSGVVDEITALSKMGNYGRKGKDRRDKKDKKPASSKVEIPRDASQFHNFFGEGWDFEVHSHNLLMQKNRIIIGNSGICPGLGLFAGQVFRKDQMICIYFGEILDEDETSNFRAKINNIYDTSYVFSLSDGKEFSIDSLVYGNKSRFVNHNEGNFNNCLIELADHNKMEYIIFKAKREIAFGEELFFDYGDSYTLHWKDVFKHLVNFLSKIADKKKAKVKVRSTMISKGFEGN